MRLSATYKTKNRICVRNPSELIYSVHKKYLFSRIVCHGSRPSLLQNITLYLLKLKTNQKKFFNLNTWAFVWTKAENLNKEFAFFRTLIWLHKIKIFSLNFHIEIFRKKNYYACCHYFNGHNSGGSGEPVGIPR